MVKVYSFDGGKNEKTGKKAKNEFFSKKGLTNGGGFSIIAKHLAGRALSGSVRHEKVPAVKKLFEKTFKKGLTKG